MQLEWTIDKISYWNREVHGEGIPGPHKLIHLYPRGKRTQHGNVEVHLQNGSAQTHREACIELLYPSLDGSMRTFKLIKQQDHWLGPNFGDIVAAIRKNEYAQPDELKVLLNKAFGTSGSFVTRLCVTDTSVKLSADTFKYLVQGKNELIFKIVYDREDGGRDYLRILASTSKDTFGEVNVQLSAMPKFRSRASFCKSVAFRQSEEISPAVASEHLITDDEILELGRLKIHERTNGFFEFRMKLAGSVKHEKANVVIYEKRKVGNAPRPDFFSTATSSEVDIGDLDAHTSALFKAFMNSGTVENLQCDSALKLYRTAHRLRVPELKRKCADFLGAKLSLSTVSHILSLANKCQDDQLKSKVRDFIVKYRSPGRWCNPRLRYLPIS